MGYSLRKLKENLIGRNWKKKVLFVFHLVDLICFSSEFMVSMMNVKEDTT